MRKRRAEAVYGIGAPLSPPTVLALPAVFEEEEEPEEQEGATNLRPKKPRTDEQDLQLRLNEEREDFAAHFPWKTLYPLDTKNYGILVPLPEVQTAMELTCESPNSRQGQLPLAGASAAAAAAGESEQTYRCCGEVTEEEGERDCKSAGPVVPCNRRSPAKQFTGTLYLTPAESLFHGSPALFDSPYLPRNVDNRLTTKWNMAVYYALKKTAERSSGGHGGYVYEYKITPRALAEYGGIPNVLFLCGSYSKFAPLLNVALAGVTITHPEHPAEGRRNYGGPHDDYLRATCGKWNGVFLPAYEDQVLVCGHHLAYFLQIHRIYQVVRRPYSDQTLVIAYADFSEP